MAGARAVVGRPRGKSALEQRVLKRATALLEREEAACLTAGEGQAGSARSRAILYLGREVSIRTQAAGQCELPLLLVRLSRPSSEISVTKFAEETGCCHLLSDSQSKNSAFFTAKSQARRSYPRLPMILRQTNSPTDAPLDKTTRASTSGASPSLRPICG
jgi:hypothetical protein